MIQFELQSAKLGRGGTLISVRPRFCCRLVGEDRQNGRHDAQKVETLHLTVFFAPGLQHTCGFSLAVVRGT